MKRKWLSFVLSAALAVTSLTGFSNAGTEVYANETGSGTNSAVTTTAGARNETVTGGAVYGTAGNEDSNLQSAMLNALNKLPESSRTFDHEITREELVYYLYQLFGAPNSGSISHQNIYFDDIMNLSEDHRAAISWAVSNMIVSGTSDSSFSPLIPVTRGEAAVIYYRCYGQLPTKTQPGAAKFSDVSSGAYIASAVQWMSSIENPLFLPASDNLFQPNAVLTYGDLRESAAGYKSHDWKPTGNNGIKVCSQCGRREDYTQEISESEKKIQTLSIDRSDVTLTIGQSTTLTAIVTPYKAAGNIRWQIDDGDGICKGMAGNENRTMYIEAKAAGTVLIKAYDVQNENIYATCKLTVKKNSVSTYVDRKTALAKLPESSKKIDQAVTRADFIYYLYQLSGAPDVSDFGEYGKSFSDISNLSTEYQNAIKWGVAHGITAGTSDTTFSPDLNLTRAQAATFFYRVYGSYPVSLDMPYKDVYVYSYAASAVEWMSTLDQPFILPISDTIFEPNAVLTYGDLKEASDGYTEHDWVTDGTGKTCSRCGRHLDDVTTNESSETSVNASIPIAVRDEIGKIVEKASVTGVAEALTDNAKDQILKAADIAYSAAGVKISVETKISLTRAQLSGSSKILVYTAYPVAVVKYGEEKSKDIAIPNSYLKEQSAIEVTLPIPNGFTPVQIKHNITGGGSEIFTSDTVKNDKTFHFERSADGSGLAVFTIHGFSEFEIMGEAASSEDNGNIERDTPSVPPVRPDRGTGRSFASSAVTTPVASDPSPVLAPSGKDDPKAPAFRDVPQNAYYAEAVKWAVSRKITFGKTALLFDPEGAYTRGQMIVMLYRAAGSPSVTGSQIEGITDTFSDLKECDSETQKAVAWALQHNVTNGLTEKTFGPQKSVTREQTVAFLYRYLNPGKASRATAFKDVKDSAWYADAVNWADQSGVTKGVNAEIFGVGQTCNRAEGVTFLYRAMK